MTIDPAARMIFRDHSIDSSSNPNQSISPLGPSFYHEYSKWKDGVLKIVFSRSVKKTDWENTKFVSGDITRIVSRLKRGPGKDIILEVGPRSRANS
ncbi:MAG: hypothetical protein WCB19_02485 [Thermoplasmata archaeon]